MIQLNPNNSVTKTVIIGDVLVVNNIIYNPSKIKDTIDGYLKKEIKQTVDSTLSILNTTKVAHENIVRSKITLPDVKNRELIFDIHKDYFLDKIDQKLEIEICELKEDILAKIEITAYLGFSA